MSSEDEMSSIHEHNERIRSLTIEQRSWISLHSSFNAEIFRFRRTHPLIAKKLDKWCDNPNSQWIFTTELIDQSNEKEKEKEKEKEETLLERAQKLMEENERRQIELLQAERAFMNASTALAALLLR